MNWRAQVAGQIDAVHLLLLIKGNPHAACEHSLQRCNLYISNDTGPMHLSTAVKTPTVALFGASNLIQWAPPWDRHAVIARKACDLMKTLSSKEWDVHPERARENLEAITPDRVMTTVEKLTW